VWSLDFDTNIQQKERDKLSKTLVFFVPSIEKSTEYRWITDRYIIIMKYKYCKTWRIDKKNLNNCNRNTTLT